MSFNLQRARGKGEQPLTQDEKDAKAWIESHFEGCQSFVEAQERLKMTEARGGARPKTKDYFEDDDDEFSDAQEGVPLWYAKKEADLDSKFAKLFEYLDKKLTKPEDRRKQNEAKGWTRASIEEDPDGIEEVTDADLDNDYYAGYVTSDDEDDVLLETDTRRLQTRILRRKRRKEARAKLAKASTPAGGDEDEEEMDRVRIDIKEVKDDDFIEYLENLARESWRKSAKSWGACPLVGYGDKAVVPRGPPPKLGNEATGPQFDAWFRSWRLYVEESATGVHPLVMKSFLRNKLQQGCSEDTWSWVEQSMKGKSAGIIIKALRNRVFSRTNMAGTFLDIVKRRQTEKQTIDQLVAENDNMITHFQRAYEDIGEALGIFLLMARVRNQRIRDKVAQMQDKPYAEICRVIMELDRQIRESERMAKKLNPEETYEVTISNTEKSYVDENGQKWVNITNGSRPTNQGRGGQRGGHGSHQQQGNKNWKSKHRRVSSSTGPECTRCGRDHEKGKCPAEGNACHRCGLKGHFASKCRSRENPDAKKSFQNKSRSRSLEPRRGTNSKAVEASNLEAVSMLEASMENFTSYSQAVTGSKRNEESVIKERRAPTKLRKGRKVDNSVKPLELIDVTLANNAGLQIEVRALPDTGANVNILPASIAKRFGIVSTEISNPKCANGSALTISGKSVTDMVYGEQLLIDIEWQVANASRVILSKGLMVEMGLLPKEFPFVNAKTVEQVDQVNNVKAEVRICNDEDVNAIASRYPEVFCGRVTMMNGNPAKIELMPDAVPTSAGHFRTIADAYLEPLKRELDAQVDAGILEKMDAKPDAAQYWLHPIVVVPKKGSKDIRLCVDFRKLNKFCLRPTNPQKTPLETVRSLPKGEVWFFCADALKGYHQIRLDEESKKKTAFYTPFGIYMYTSLPMGYAASQDIFTDRFGNAVDDLVQARVTEDCLITASDRQMFLKRIDQFFARCKEHGIVLNAKKTQVGPEVVFGGFKLNKEGYCLDPSLHDAIRKFPPPTTLTELRSFMGLINQTTTFTDKIAELASPLKELLKSKVDYVWTAHHQTAFEKAREELANPRQLAYFDHRRPTRLYTDASRLNGLGFVVKQLQDDGNWRIVQAGSRFLSSAETRYAMVELELLAIAWSMQKARPFLEGIRFDVMTDHKPLIPICNNYALSDIENKRLQRLKMKLSGFTFEVHWVQGKDNVEADALSRAPVDQPKAEDEIDEIDQYEVLHTSKTAISALNAVEMEGSGIWENHQLSMEFECCLVDKLVEEIREAGEKDENYKEIKSWLGMKYPPPRHRILPKLDPYYKEVERFSIDESGLLCHDDQVVVPQPLRNRFIDHLVGLHASPEKMITRARKSVWWPFMNADIKQRWRTCRTCVERSPSKPAEPIRPRQITTYPFQIVHMDLGSYAGNHWLIIIDQFSGWPIVRNLKKDTTTSRVTEDLLKMFEQYGLPEAIYSDGGPQFESEEFAEFCAKWKIDHTTSSPHYPQSNGIAENGVKAMKKLIHCSYDPERGCVNKDEWTRAIMIYKNTPKKGSKLSPAEILFGKLIRDGIASPKELYEAKHRQAVDRRLDEIQRYITQMSNLRTTRSNEMRIGDRVFIQDHVTKKWNRLGTIEKEGKNDREFWVRTEFGGLWRRNRRFLKLQDPLRLTKSAMKQETSPVKDEKETTTPKQRGRPKGSRNVRFDLSEPTRRSTRESRTPVRYQA